MSSRRGFTFLTTPLVDSPCHTTNRDNALAQVMRGRVPAEAVPEASLRIAEDQEQNLGEREPRESISFIRIRSSGICPDYLNSEENLGENDREIGDHFGAHELGMASLHQVNMHL